MIIKDIIDGNLVTKTSKEIPICGYEKQLDGSFLRRDNDPRIIKEIVKPPEELPVETESLFTSEDIKDLNENIIKCSHRVNKKFFLTEFLRNNLIAYSKAIRSIGDKQIVLYGVVLREKSFLYDFLNRKNIYKLTIDIEKKELHCLKSDLEQPILYILTDIEFVHNDKENICQNVSIK